MAQISVLVADAQWLFAEALGEALNSRNDLNVIEEYPTSGQDVVEALQAYQPDVTLIDYWMPGMEGPAIVASVRARLPAAKILLLSWFHGVREVKNAIDAGAVGFLPKSLKVDEVAEAIRWAYAGQSPVFPEKLDKLIENIDRKDQEAVVAWQKLGRLTPREVQILQMLAYGQPIARVARKLNIAPSTLRTHIHNILDKTGAGSQIEALSLARRYGLIQ